MYRISFKIVFFFLILTGCQSAPTNNEKLETEGKSLKGSPKNNTAEKVVLTAGLKLTNVDRRVKAVVVTCKNLDTGKLHDCIGDWNDRKFFTKKTRDFELSDSLKILALSSYRKLPQGRYTFSHINYLVRVGTNFVNGNASDIISASKIYFNKGAQVPFEINEGLNYLGDLSIDLGFDYLYRPQIKNVSITRDFDSMLANLPKSKKKRIENSKPLQVSISPISYQKSYTLIGQWGTLDLESKCAHAYKILTSSVRSKVEAGKLTISKKSNDLPTLPSEGMSKVIECALVKHMRKNNYKEFRQTSKISITTDRDISKGFRSYNLANTFYNAPVEFR